MKYKYGDRVVIKIPDSIFYNLEGEIIEFTSKPYDMYTVSVLDGVRIGVIEKYLTKLN